MGLLPHCDLVLGAGQYHVVVEGSAPPPPCGGFAFSAPECGGCVEASCCAEGDACRESSDCAALFDCLAACEARDGACRFECKSQHSTVQDSAADAFGSCRTQKCTTSCVGCGGIFDRFASTCDACMEKRCCEESAACATDEGCEAFVAEMNACTDPWCLHFLFSHGFPPAELERALACGWSQCPTQCAIGSQWDCVGEYGFQGDTLDPVTFIFWLDYAGASPSAVEVKACTRADLDCEPALDTKMSASDVAVVSIPGAFNGYFSLTGAGMVPTIYYHPHPLWFEMGTWLVMYSPEILANLFGEAILDDTLGSLDIKIADCFGQPAPGISYSISNDAGAIAFYERDEYPVTTETETDATGHGGFAKVQPGVVTVRATLHATGQVVAETSVVVRPGTITTLDLLPTD